jgi:signal transduction histidine kinase
MIIDLMKSNFRAPDLPDADWEQLRLLLLKRSLLVLAPVNLIYTLLTGALGHPVLPSAIGLACNLLLMAVVRSRPRWRKALVWAFGLSVEVLLLLSLKLWQRPQPAPALVIAALMGTLGLMLDGAVLGWTVFILSVGLCARAGLSLAVGDDAGLPKVLMLGSLNVILFTVSLGWYRGLMRGQAALAAASRSLLKQRDERQVLSLALFHELNQAQQRLARVAGEDDRPLNWEQVARETEQMQARAMEIRALRNTFDETPAAAPAEAEFSRGVMLAILGACLTLASAGFVLRLVLDLPGLWHAALILPLFGAGLYSLRGGRPVQPWLAWLPVLLAVIILGGDTVQAWGRAVPTTAAYWCLAILMAGLLQGWRSALGIAGLSLLIVGAAAAALPAGPVDGGGRQFALVLAFGFCMVVAICLQGLVWQRSVVQLQEQGRRQLERSLAQRRRLLGTLFHDAANPIMALLGLSEQARAGLAAPGDEARARRLSRRLGELLGDSQAWLMAEDPELKPGLGVVELEPVLAGVADLFQERLATKRLGLALEVEAGLRAEAQVAVLRDSVLSNLVSNAIKFSRPGTSLELAAHHDDGQALIELRDRGPGLTPELLRALEGGQDLPSAPGTGGEAGQGLGLALAREHMQRMGGRLELQEREGGGTVARLWLKAA